MCVLYGREGYHAQFLKPLAYLLRCRYVALDYMTLYEKYLSGERGVYYVEEPWIFDRESQAPEPPHRLPPQLDYLRGRMLPILGNVQAYFKTAVDRGCLGLLAKPGEPLVTDFYLPLYLQHGDAERALEVAREVHNCAAKSREQLVEGIGVRYNKGVIWTAWVVGMDVTITTPPWGFTMSGVWGLTWVGEQPRDIDFYAYPPPYVEYNQSPLYINAVPLRRGGWMKYVIKLWPQLYRYLEKKIEKSEVLPHAREIERYISTAEKPPRNTTTQYIYT